MKCFSIDLDGTLLNSNSQISEENSKTLQYLQEKGHTVIINTGRAVEDVLKFKPIREVNLPIISINGTIIYSNEQEILYEASIPLETSKDLLSILRELGLYVMIYTNQGGFPFRNPIAQGKSPSELKQIFESYDYDHVFEKDGIKIYKLMAVATDDKLDQIAQARKCVGEQFELSIASSHPNNIEFTSIEANKGIALKRYQAIQGVSFKEIYAFGDGGNDIEQFKVATTAVAMANAPANVQQKAHLITKSNDENGFTYAIKELLKI